MPNKLHFSIEIAAEADTIWKNLWDDSAYRSWSSIFFEGSYMLVDDWDAGSIVQFLGPDKSGIYSKIEVHEAGSIIQFKHVGNVVDGINQELDEETKKWTGATETYTVKKCENGNLLAVDIDVMDEHVAFMNTKLPMALQHIKERCGQ